MHDQAAFDLRCEWGPEGLRRLAPGSDAVVLVDALSFSTSVDVAVARGVEVVPCRWGDARAEALASERGAVLARPRGSGGPSLSPPSLAALPAGSRVVLPSPNGATLATLAPDGRTLAGCFRNASAVARAAARLGPRVSVIPAGERWEDSGTLRPALEDWLAAGAVLAALPGRRSPEAEAAVCAFHALRGDLHAWLLACASGEELVQAGYAEDVAWAAALDASRAAPLLRGGAFADAARGPTERADHPPR